MNTSDVSIGASGITLPGILSIPSGSRAVVVFAHGSGSSRFSPRNASVASYLNHRGLGTLLFDLLDEDEAAQRDNVFDIDLLASRLADTCRWVEAHPSTAASRIGLFGASTGAAAALTAAAMFEAPVDAVVSRGGRPDLAGDALRRVSCPTLLIVGGYDHVVLALNRRALRALGGDPHRLDIVPRAGHLFEEPGALDVVARLAADWFERWLDPGERTP